MGKRKSESTLSSLTNKVAKAPSNLFNGASYMLKRWSKAFVVGCTSTMTMSGAMRIASASAVLACTIAGPKNTVVIITVASVGTVFVTAMSTLISADLGGEPVLGDEQDDMLMVLKAQGGIWGGVAEVMNPKQLDRLMKACPMLYRPQLDLMRRVASAEFWLRVMTVFAAHAEDGPSPGSLKPQQSKGSSSSSKKGQSSTEGNGQDEDEGADDKQEQAPEELMDELRQWLPYAEASYHNMSTSDMMEEWLSKRGWQLMVALTSSFHGRPAHCVAVNDSEKLLLILVRGTMTVSDALTDMMLAPTVWEHEGHDHQIHQGMASSAMHLYTRLGPLARAFHDLGYKIQVVGHSLGAGAAALMTWLLMTRDGVDNIRTVAYAMPPCVSPEVAKECKDTVVACVMRDDIVPRITMHALLHLEEQIMSVSWDQMESATKGYGDIGAWVVKQAKEAAEKNETAPQELSREDAIAAVQKLEEKKKEEEGEGDQDGGEDESGEKQGGQGEQQQDGDGIDFDPTVPGTIVWLKPTSERTRKIQPITSSGPEDVPGTKEDEKEINPTREDAFEHLIVGAKHPTMHNIRVAMIAMNDHFFDAYRLGLKMLYRPPPPEGEDKESSGKDE